MEWKRQTLERDGVNLAVFSAGPADATTILFVHGWPDTHDLWTRMAEILSKGYRVVAFDTRGYGASDRLTTDAAYRMPELVKDIAAVGDWADNGQPLILVGHDWGSIQCWATVQSVDDLFAGYVTISGPGLDHAQAWMRERKGSLAGLWDLAQQAVGSFYIPIFRSRLGPTFVKVATSDRVWRRYLSIREGLPPELAGEAPTFRDDAQAGLAYYRANLGSGAKGGMRGVPGLKKQTSVPVLQVINSRDTALRPVFFEGSERRAQRMWRREVDSGHWLPRADPATAAQLVDEFATMLAEPADSPTAERWQKFRLDSGSADR